MFRSLFKVLKKKDIELEKSKENVSKKIIIESKLSDLNLSIINLEKMTENKSEEINEFRNKTSQKSNINKLPQKSKKYIIGKNNYTVLQDIEELKEYKKQVNEKIVLKKSSNESYKNDKILRKYKYFYDNIFIGCHNIDEVIDTYIEYTNYTDIKDELRLEYISMYIFNNEFIKDKLTIKAINSLLNKQLATFYEIEGELLNDVSKELYKELKENIGNRISECSKTNHNIYLDNILISIFIEYELEIINSNIFIQVLTKILKELNIIKNETKSSDIMEYLKQNTLRVIDIQFLSQIGSIGSRCNVFFLKRNILIKTKDSNQIISSFNEGPINIDTSPILDIEGTLFFVNSCDETKISNYFKSINDDIIIAINKEFSIAIKEVNNPSIELVTLIQNFMNILPLNILLDRNNFIAFENIISVNDFIREDFLDSEMQQRANIKDLFIEDIALYNNINSFYKEQYIKLIKISSKYINIPEKYHSSVIWKLIKTISIPFVSKYWDSEYNIHIKSDNCTIDFDEYIDMYCRCLEIPIKNIIVIGAFTYFLMEKKLFPVEINYNFIKANTYLIDRILQKTEEIELELFEDMLRNSHVSKVETYSISDVDLMDGYEFENFVSILFTKMGYITEITKTSGDQGMDVIAEKNGYKIGIQAKCYSSKVSNRAIQEIFTALNHYNCDKGIVVTNNYFTDLAVELAKSNNVILWDRFILKSKIDEVFN